MKQIYVVFSDEEFEKLKKEKDDLSWHDFIMELIEEVKLNGNN